MNDAKNHTSKTTLSSSKYGNAFVFEKEQELQKKRTKKLQWFFVALLILGYIVSALAQQIGTGQNYTITSTFEPTIKDAVKLNDLPDIKDTTNKITNINYGINSNPLVGKYEVIPIDAAKMQNEPLTKLYRSLLKIGMGNYTTPYAEFWINSLRSRNMAYGFHYKHLSSASQLKNVG